MICLSQPFNERQLFYIVIWSIPLNIDELWWNIKTKFIYSGAQIACNNQARCKARTETLTLIIFISDRTLHWRLQKQGKCWKYLRTLNMGKVSRTGRWGQTRQAIWPLDKRRQQLDWCTWSVSNWFTWCLRCMVSGIQLSPPYVLIFLTKIHSLKLWSQSMNELPLALRQLVDCQQSMFNSQISNDFCPHIIRWFFGGLTDDSSKTDEIGQFFGRIGVPEVLLKARIFTGLHLTIGLIDMTLVSKK